MLEVFTIGGGEYIVNVFNAVAAWSGGGGYRSMIQVVMVMGLMYSLVVVSFNLDWRAWMNWFLQATMIYMMLLVPTVTVKVTDRVNPSLAPAVVGNVPLGLGVMASFTSQIGDYLTRSAETVFVMPNALALSNNGMVYGARLFDKAQTFTLTNSAFRANLDEHLKQCVFYDVLLGFKSMDAMSRSNSLWEALSPGSPSRAQKWIESTGTTTTSSSIIPCAEAYTRLDSRWTTEIEADLLPFAKQSYPKILDAAAVAKLKADLPIAANQFHGTTSTDAISYLRQVSMVDAFRAARESFSDAEWDAYASQRAEAQARNSYTGIAQQAMTWVPILNVVLTCVFYAMFPVIFPLFLFPRTGPTTLKGYATGFFYLAAWGPLYVVLHMFVMSRAADAIKAVSPTGPTLLVTDGIQAVNNDIATIAGFLMMSVPFIAAGMARGALAISGQATSMLAPAQGAAEAAAIERTTGNYTYGNTSFANTTANMMQANKWDTTPVFSSGFASSSFTGADGVAQRGFSDGSISWDSRNAMSYVPNRIDSRQSVAWSLNRMIGEEEAKSERISEARVLSDTTGRRQSHSTGVTTSNSAGTEASSGRQWGTSSDSYRGTDVGTGARIETGTRAEEGAGVSQAHTDQKSNTKSDSFSYGGDGRFSITGGGKVGFGNESGGGGGGRVGGSISGALTGGMYLDKKISDTDSEETSDRQTVEHHSNLSRNASTSRSADTRDSVGTKDSESTGTYGRDGEYRRRDRTSSESDTRELTFSSEDQKRKAWEQSQDRIQRLSEMKSRVESGEMQISGDITTPVAAAYEEYRSLHPDEYLPPVASPYVSADQNRLRETKLRELAAEYLEPTLNGRLAGPNLDNNLRLDLPTPAPEPSNPPRGVGPVPSGGSAGGGGRSYDARADARENGMAVKSGADIDQLDRRMAPVVDAVADEAERLGLSPRAITSGDDGRHVTNSRHYDGQGLDFRGRDISVAQGRALAQGVQSRLGPGYRAEFEVFPDEPERNHLHVQTTGRR